MQPLWRIENKKMTKAQLEAKLATVTASLQSTTSDRDAWRERVNNQAPVIRNLHDSLSAQTRAHQEERSRWQERVSAPYKRQDFEGLTTEQLRTAAAEIIAECRRKNLLEVKGLVARHREMLESTDIELMDGMARTYAERANRLRLEKKTREQSKPNIDTRTLRQKLDAATQMTLNGGSAPYRYAIAETLKCWCGTSLIRGQCPTHTTVWHGEERCFCGRSFAFCKSERARGHWHAPGLHRPANDGPVVSTK